MRKLKKTNTNQKVANLDNILNALDSHFRPKILQRLFCSIPFCNVLEENDLFSICQNRPFFVNGGIDIG